MFNHVNNKSNFFSDLEEISRFIDLNIKNVKDVAKICLNIIYSDNIDVLMVNFQSNDTLQHILWGFISENHYFFNEKIRNYIFKNFYKTLDLAIETLREEFIRKSSGDVLTIILSDHGFESHKKCFYLRTWLYKNNFLRMKNKPIIRILFSKWFKTVSLMQILKMYYIKS